MEGPPALLSSQTVTSPSPRSPPAKTRPARRKKARLSSASTFGTAKEEQRYGKIANRIYNEALSNDGGWKKLAYLTDNIGHRLSGSNSLTKALSWAKDEMKRDGLSDARVTPVMVPNWKRGVEKASIRKPLSKSLHITTLGNSIGTRKPIVAKVVLANSFEALDKLGAKAKGKIVLFTHAMPPFSQEGGSGYGDAVKFRVYGPSKAAKYGAKAVLVRSLTAHSLQSPHTGTLYYEEDAGKIPAAAVTVEDAELIERLVAQGQDVVVSLELGAKILPDAKSGNVIAELKGTTNPEQIVLLGAHIDSWDVGQGAHDDGTGCAIMMQAVALLKKLGLAPKRTIRVVLFTNEENGGRGAKAYFAENKDPTAIKNHVLAIESDSGGFSPQGFSVQGSSGGRQDANAIVSLLSSPDKLGKLKIKEGYPGADIHSLADAGVPGLGLWVHGDKYFDYHHTEADTLDKVNPTDLQKNIALVATIAFIAADMPKRFGEQ